MGLTVGHDRLGLGLADAVELLLQGQGVGGVQVELGRLRLHCSRHHLSGGQLGDRRRGCVGRGAEREGQAGEQREEQVGKDGVAH